MARLRTNDDVLRTRAVYIGPKGHTLPVRWTFVQWGIGAALTLPTTLTAAILFGPYSLGLGFGAGLIAAVFICRAISPDRPARAVLRTAATDWRAPRAPDDGSVGSPIRYTTTHLTGGEQ